MTTTFGSRERARVQHLVVHWRGHARDATPATGLRLEHLLSQADWHPRGMKASEILLIRRLRLPPQCVLRTDQLTLGGWDADLLAVLDDLYRTAIRVRPGVLLSNANSVVFDDVAALLISLTLEVLDTGHNAVAQMAGHWYWQQVLGAQLLPDRGALLSALWSRYPEHLPAALAGLHVAQAYPAVAMLDVAGTHAVLQALATAYDFILPPSILEAPVPIQTNGKEPGSSHAVPEPWAVWLPHALPPGIRAPTRRARLLLGLCAALHAAPAFARSNAFLVQVEHWWRSLEHPDEPAASQLTEQAATGMARASGSAEAGGASATLQERVATAQPAAQAPSPAAPRTSDVMVPSEGEGQPLDMPFCQQTLLPVEAMWTHLGGVLFLVNVLAWLPLPAIPDAPISGWDLIAALALMLLGGSGREPDIAVDPIWDVLAALAGRAPGTPITLSPGERGLEQGGRLPSNWVRRYCMPAQWVASASQGQLLLCDPEHAFLAAEVPLEDAEPREVADSILSDLVGLTAVARQMLVDGIAGWLEHSVGFVRRLLVECLVDDDATLPSLAELIVLKNSRLAVTRTHVDLYLPLEATDLCLRRAGLDRDPGWVPDLGYIVLFHFGETFDAG